MPICWHCLTSQSDKPSEEKSAIVQKRLLLCPDDDFCRFRLSEVIFNDRTAIVYTRSKHPRGLPLSSMFDDVNPDGAAFFFFEVRESLGIDTLLPPVG